MIYLLLQCHCFRFQFLKPSYSILYYYEEMTMAEIAKVLELPESTISEMHSSVITRCQSYLHGIK
ncbi:sigma factor-like helix-turn-helix DNA-binding protein [Planctomycetota bacterium]